MGKSWQMKLDIGRVSDKVREAAGEGLELAAEHVIGVAKSRAPHEEGTLERSGAQDTDRAALRSALSFDTPYAVVQHEDLTLTHDDGRQAKYLESAMTGERDTALQIISAQIRRALT